MARWFSWFTLCSSCFCFSPFKLEGKNEYAESNFSTLVHVPMPGNPECEISVSLVSGENSPKVLYLTYRDLLLLDLHYLALATQSFCPS